MYHCLFSKWQFRLKDLSIPDFIGLMTTWVFFNTVSCKIPQKDFYKGNTYIYIFFPKNVLDQKKKFFDQIFFYSSQKVESTRVDYF